MELKPPINHSTFHIAHCLVIHQTGLTSTISNTRTQNFNGGCMRLWETIYRPEEIHTTWMEIKMNLFTYTELVFKRIYAQNVIMYKYKRFTYIKPKIFYT